MSRAATLDGASAGNMASGCFWTMSLRLGSDIGSATASATQNAITAKGHRVTALASRRTTTLHTVPQSPPSATC